MPIACCSLLMILLLQLFALYTLHCYAAYSLLLLPYDPPPTALCSLYTALLRCLQAAAPSL
jgi:hypothetical protein